MNKIALLLAATLLVANSIALAETGSSADLRYCLDLPSSQQIAKCAGEIASGSKGQPFSREEVDKILSEGKASTPASTSSVPATQPVASDKPIEEPTPSKTEGSSN